MTASGDGMNMKGAYPSQPPRNALIAVVGVRT